MLMNIIYLIISTSVINICVGKNYSNYTLYRVIPENESHVDFITKLNNIYDVNFWREPSVVNRAIDFVINPEDQPDFLRDAESHNINYKTLIKDVQKEFDQQTVKTYTRRDMGSFDWNNYFRLDDIYDWLRDLANIYREEFQILTLGKSHENRDILAVKIDLKKSKAPKPKIIIEGGIHAREWIAPTVVTYLIYQIINADTSSDKLLRDVAYSYEWYFVPVLNVDGYEYTHTTDRLWRKNRHGDGVDLNRNFAHAFGSVGVSSDKSSDIYNGEKAFSEKETLAMANFVKSKRESLEYYIGFHSYGQFMVLPYANTKGHLDNYDEVYAICKDVAQKIRARYNTIYIIGTAYDTVGYMSSGASMDWVKSNFKVPYVMTFELRDQGYYGFALAPSSILLTCRETIDGLVELFNPLRGKKISSKGGCAVPYNVIVVFSILLFILMFLH